MNTKIRSGQRQTRLNSTPRSRLLHLLSDVIASAHVPHRLNAIPLGNHFHSTELRRYACSLNCLGDFIDALWLFAMAPRFSPQMASCKPPLDEWAVAGEKVGPTADRR
jgi:hypothetical protein